VTAPNISDSLSLHLTSPEVSVDEHVRRRNIELGESAMARDRIYLDKCFWIYLRNARTKKTNESAAYDLLDGLVQSVKRGHRACPISDTLFLELLKQSDLQTRAATAELIDELSCGVTLVPHPTRVATEIAHFFHVNSAREVYPLESLVWSKLTNVLGVQHPSASAHPPEERLAIQKAFFDYTWDISLLKMLEITGDSGPPESSYAELAARLNQGNAAHVHRMDKFSQVYEDEIFGCLELAAPIACDVLHDMAEKIAGRSITVSTEGREAAINEAYAFLRAVIARQPVKRALRTLHLEALFHAAMRWNRTQKIVANDLYDFHHAEAALGYCDVFLTDGPMHTLLNQGHLAIQRDFSCHIISSLGEAASWSQGWLPLPSLHPRAQAHPPKRP
jgi:hypothetical protein